MGIVDNLLTASRRPAREALRVTAALNETLDAPLRDPDGTINSLSVVAAADAAHQRVALEISEEKNPRPAPPSEHTEAFIETAAVEESLIRDAPPTTEENVRTDPYYLLVGDEDSTAGEEENTSAATPWHIPEKVAVASDTTAAPSPRTKPSRSASKGRQASCGLPFRVDKVRIAPKAASTSGIMGASVPPAIIIRAFPWRIMS